MRTAYLALAQCKKDEYIIEYVMRLIESYDTDGEDFEVNRKIQCAYYGEGRLMLPAVRKRVIPAV